MMSWLPKEQDALKMFLGSLNSTDGMGIYQFLSEQPADQAKLRKGRFRRSITANACLRALKGAAAKGTPQKPTITYSSDDKLLRPTRNKKDAIAAQLSAFGNWIEGFDGIMLVFGSIANVAETVRVRAILRTLIVTKLREIDAALLPRQEPGGGTRGKVFDVGVCARIFCLSIDVRTGLCIMICCFYIRMSSFWQSPPRSDAFVHDQPSSKEIINEIFSGGTKGDRRLAMDSRETRNASSFSFAPSKVFSGSLGEAVEGFHEQSQMVTINNAVWEGRV
jgi:hypothetical protein